MNFSAILTKEGGAAVRRKYIFLLVPLFLFLLSGSRPVPRQTARYVVQAEVLFTQPGQTLTLHFRQTKKLTSLLTCLRLAAPEGLSNAPPMDENAHHYRITLYYSDRTQRVFHLENYRYLSSDRKTWQKVPADKAHLFYLLIHLLPSD